MKYLLENLFQGDSLSRGEAKSILMQISRGIFNESQLASFLTIFRMRPIRTAELQGFRDALLELARPVDFSGIESVDIVGTGGDGKNTFNISTASCVVVASAGYNVTKHGNYGVSSVSGSSNVLEALGYKFTNDDSELYRRLERSKLVFLHAPLFHPAMKEVAPVRKALGIKTFFNLLGPLVNPSRPTHQFLGVYSLPLARLYAEVLKEEAVQYGVIYAIDGYDEVSLTNSFLYKTKQVDAFLEPEDLGLNRQSPTDLFGGNTVAEAANIFKNILLGKGTEAQKSVVAANAGLAIHLFKPLSDYKECVAEAKSILESDTAWHTFELAKG